MKGPYTKMEFSSFDAFIEKYRELRSFLAARPQTALQLTSLGTRYKEILEQIDPLIQGLTAKSCPYCGVVCCAQKFGLPNSSDMVTFLAMNVNGHVYDFQKDPRSMCQFMGEKGCILPRYQRPFRCTFYFCDPLLIQIDLLPKMENERLIQGLKKLESLRQEMTKLAETGITLA